MTVASTTLLLGVKAHEGSAYNSRCGLSSAPRPSDILCKGNWCPITTPFARWPIAPQRRQGNVLDVKDVLPVAGRALKLTIQPWEVRDAAGFDTAFAALSRQRPDGLYVLASPLMFANEKRIAGLALKSRLPSMFRTRAAVDAGGLMYYAADLSDSYRRVAIYVDKILKGAKPADLPIEQPTKFQLVINLKTAKQIGVTIPQKVLARANTVIK
jgi:putative ABC transport system substrate-binding protein